MTTVLHIPLYSFAYPLILLRISPYTPSHIPLYSFAYPLILLRISPYTPSHIPLYSFTYPLILLRISPYTPSHIPLYSFAYPLILLRISPYTPSHCNWADLLQTFSVHRTSCVSRTAARFYILCRFLWCSCKNFTVMLANVRFHVR